jgi:hypothetical protein
VRQARNVVLFRRYRQSRSFYSFSSSPQMCSGSCILWLFRHRRWQYNPDLELIFSFNESRHSLAHYLYKFLSSIPRAPTIARTLVQSVAYCRTRGPSAYPFFIVQLKHLDLRPRRVWLKLQGFDGPLTVRKPNDPWSPYGTPEERSRSTLRA